jgi:hypothetical protein
MTARLDGLRRGLSDAATRAVFASLVALFAGCGEDGEGPPPPPTGNSEGVSAPVQPGGPTVASVSTSYTFTTGGGVTTLAHPIEYRFDFDAKGAHDYSAWSPSNVALKTWTNVGIRDVTAQARCAIHTDKVSEWSLAKSVEIGVGPETELMAVVNTYFTTAGERTRVINFADGLPDTVPYDSWVTLFYRGIPSALGDALCNDEINECLRYQVNYTRVSERNPALPSTIAWRPFDPADKNSAGVDDSTTMNVGSVDYTMRARGVDQFNRSDISPAELQIVGNFSPTLDTRSLTNYNGANVANGDTMFWNWWRPANFHGSRRDTLDTSNPLDTMVVKSFYFVVGATGHDHPDELPDAGVKSWRYTFQKVGTNPPVYYALARSGLFVDALAVNELSDTAMVTFRYSLSGDPGGAARLADLPGYIDSDLDFAIVGRDVAVIEDFNQRVHYGSGFQLVESYNTAEYGKWTAAGRLRFHVKLKR